MSWIETVPVAHATGRLRDLYARVAGPRGEVDNIMRVHSLRPHTLEGHMGLYKAVLHHTGNRLPGWVLETIGVHVSRINDCAYCVDHHAAGLRRLVGDEEADALLARLTARAPAETGTSRAEKSAQDDLDVMLDYATRLTLRPAEVTEQEVDALRARGLDDGQILELNQVVSYFAYANRTVLGLGVDTRGDVLGLAPANREDGADWRHV